MWAKIKHWGIWLVEGWGTLIILLLVSLSSFALGRLSVLWDDGQDLKIIQENKAIYPAGQYPGGEVIGSQTTGLYDAPWCSGAKVADGVWYKSEQAALEDGLKPDMKCRGMGN